MQNRERTFGERVGRVVLIIVGALGALAAVDAVLMFLVLLLAAIFIEAPDPYIGLLMFIALPFIALVGGALAWIGYTVLMTPAPEPDADGQQVHV